YRIVGGVRFYQRKEIKDVFAYLRAVVNPNDTVSIRRIVNTPKRGIGDATVAAIEEFSRDEGLAFLVAARRADEISVLGQRARGAVAGFVGLIDHLAAVVSDGAGVARMVEEAFTESGYVAELEEQRTIEPMGRVENREERPLAHVGITRARKRLYLTHAWSRSLFGGSNYNPPSRFLNEIPAELVHSADGEPAADAARRGGGYGHEPLPIAAGDTVFHDR